MIPLALAVCLVGGLWLGRSLAPVQTDILSRGGERYEKMRDIIEILDNKYVDSVDANKLFEQSIADMLHKLDPHSNYISAEDLQATNEQIEGHFGGIGVRFSIIRDTICVTHVIAGSPSQDAGLQAADRIIEIGGKPVAHRKITNEKVMSQLKGPANTAVEVSLLRKGKKIRTKITRGVIPLETVTCATMLDANVGYIKLEQFSVVSADEFSKAAAKLKAQGMKKLVFDLRNNGGGVLASAVAIVDEFLSDGKLIVETRGLHSRKTQMEATHVGILENIDLVVLVNSNSASASEIVAGALQDNDRATIMGRRSFGKGLVQEDIMLKDGSNLRLTIARYYTPTGRSIQKPYTEGFDAYYQDQADRFENGELYQVDSTLLVDSLKFKTPKGKIVYGGGGILPDVFIPIDTNGNSWYFADLRYSGAFQNFAFDFVADKRTKWKSAEEFNKQFNVSDQLLNSFVLYAEKNQKIYRNQKGLNLSKHLIEQTLKAEIARQIWTEQGYFIVANSYDKEVLAAWNWLKKGKK